jgi:hypothetical protein
MRTVLTILRTWWRSALPDLLSACNSAVDAHVATFFGTRMEGLGPTRTSEASAADTQEAPDKAEWQETASTVTKLGDG